MRLNSEIRHIETTAGLMKLIILRPESVTYPVPGMLWIHGGGYISGMAEMVYVSRGADVARRYGAVVVSPEYRLATKAPYPAALEDCYAALVYLKNHAAELGIRSDQIMVGGESAGGGLAAAVCMAARDREEVNVCYQMPLYPMLDCRDTESSRNNHGLTWNTERNHHGWKIYLGPLYGSNDVPPYASPSRQRDYTKLPPCYTFICKGEPFYSETMTYVHDLQQAGVEATVDVFPGDVHAFDMFLAWTEQGRRARASFRQHYQYAAAHYFAPQKEE